MTTRDELVASIHAALHSYTGVQEQSTHLTASCTASEVTLSVAGAEQVLRGIAEIDDELVYVNASSGTELTLAPYGRGYRGSTAASHLINTQVTFDPAFPRAEIGKAIDQTLASLYPSLYQVKSTTLTGSAVDVSYVLPADCGGVLNVEVKRTGDPSDYWLPVQRWECDTQLNLYDGVTPGTTIRVHYWAPFGALSADFATAGIPESYADLLTYGTAARLIRFSGPSRIQLGAVENVSRAQVVGADDAGRMANQLYAIYQTRVAEERKRLLEAHPARPNFSAR